MPAFPGEAPAAWRHWREISALLEAAAGGAQALAQEREQLEWQVRELETLGFSLAEWDALNIEHKRLGHAARLVEGARFSLDLLAEGDAACEQQVDIVARRLDSLAEYDPALAYGDVYALHQLWGQLGFVRAIARALRSSRREFDAEALVRAMATVYMAFFRPLLASLSMGLSPFFSFMPDSMPPPCTMKPGMTR